MINYLLKRPMLIAALGSCVVSVCAFYSDTALFICACVVSLLLFVAILIKNNRLLVAALLILVVAASCFLTLFKIQDLNHYRSSKISAQVVILENNYKGESIYKSDVEIISSNKIRKGVKISLWHPPEKVNMGDIYNIEFVADRIDEKYKASSYSDGIYLEGNALRFNFSGKTDGVLSEVSDIRKYIKSTLFENMDYSSAATLCALVMGERSYFTDEFYSNVKGAGVAHVMVVSGMHLTIIVSLFLRLIEEFMRNPIFKAVTILAVVITLSALCGFTMSILRAGVTYLIMAVGILFDKSYSGENALGAAVTLITLFSPFAVLSVAFQLSVLSTFGILAVALPICRYFESRRIITSKLKLFIFESVTVSLSAILLTLPVIIYVFGYVSTVSVITNLLIDYPVTLSLWAAVIGLIIGLFIPFGAKLVFFFTEIAVKYINGVINYLGSRRFSVLRLPEESSYISVAGIIAVFWCLLTCKKRIDMLKLKEMNTKIREERGGAKKWQSFMRKH